MGEETLAALLPDLYGFAVVMTRDRSLAEDVVIEAVARALPHVGRGRVADLPVYLPRVEERAAPADGVPRLPDIEAAVDDRLLGVDAGTVKSQTARVLAKLRAVLEGDHV